MIATPAFMKTSVAGYSQVAKEYDSRAKREGINFALLRMKDVALSLRGWLHPFFIVEPYPMTSVVVARMAD